MSRLALALIITLLLSATPAYADDYFVEIGLADAARVMGAADRVPDLVTERDALREENAALKAQLERVEKLAALNEQILERQERLTALADEERDRYKARLEKVEQDAKKGRLWSTVKERAAEGALLGTIGGSAIPGVGNVLGGLGGAAIGGLVGLIEGLSVQGP